MMRLRRKGQLAAIGTPLPSEPLPRPACDADASSVIATIPAGGALEFSTDAGLLTPGTTISVKIFVVLTTGNERGSNTVTITRPVQA